MKKRITLMLICCFQALLSQDKTPEISLMNNKHLDADIYFGQDNSGYIYYSKDNVFYKNKDAEYLQYKNPALGSITRVDIDNPLNIVLFYELFNVVISLDNQLNEIKRINFSNTTEQISVTATGIASQNRLWIFNALNMRLGLYDVHKNFLQYIGTPFTMDIKFYHTDFNYFYWVDLQNNLHVCDIFGKTTFLGKIPNAEKVVFISNKELLILKDNTLFWFNTSNNNLQNIDVDKKTLQNVSYKDQILTIFTKKEISNYKIILP
ncbi:MAG: hypothetical protein RBR78_00315 [Flavobacteriaceae bacterium]|jgi:hypothetical protein|nr:hypothetical protein [Flavobacteriaceae bacterium]